MIPSIEDLEKLAKNIDFKLACTLDCHKCEWKTRIEDCRTLAKIELGRKAKE